MSVHPGNLGQTQFKRLEQYKDRWTSFGASTGILELSEKPTPTILRGFEIFREYDDKFLEKISPDVSIAKWKKETVLFEEGSYLDLAFYVVEGSVDVYVQKQQSSSLGAPLFDRARTAFMAEAGTQEQPQASGARTIFDAQVSRQEKRRSGITFLSVMDFDLPIGKGARLNAGEIFGEIGAMSGWPQSVTARTVTECTLVQIRVPALRLMKRKSSSLKSRVDKLYRERTLASQLKLTPLFRGCDDAFIQSISQKVDLISCEPDEVIAKEGEPVDAFYIVRSGFVKLSQRLGDGSIAVSYLSKGSTLGEAELLIEELKGWTCTATSKEYAELVKINGKDFQQIFKQLPKVENLLWESAVARIKEAGFSRRNLQQSEFIDTALEKGLVEGNSILIIDLNVCTRCDDCVRGCSDTHGGIPRFVREGDKVGDFLITRACYHCRDPVCLVGCPTGAIRRAAVGDVVEIDEKLCIGCGTCANNCPYDAIIMRETGEAWPADMVPEGLRGKDKQIATKCDLCYTDPAGPACVRSCPHGCAFRVGSIQEFQKLLWKD